MKNDAASRNKPPAGRRFSFAIPALSPATPVPDTAALEWIGGKPVDSYSQVITILGHVLELTGDSVLHLNYQVGELRDRVVPALPLGQYLLGLDQHGRAQAFTSWAYVTDEIRSAFQKGEIDTLAREKWRCGTDVFVLEFIAMKNLVRPLVRKMIQCGGDGFPAFGCRIRVTADGKTTRRPSVFRNVSGNGLSMGE